MLLSVFEEFLFLEVKKACRFKHPSLKKHELSKSIHNFDKPPSGKSESAFQIDFTKRRVGTVLDIPCNRLHLARRPLPQGPPFWMGADFWEILTFDFVIM